MANLGRFSKNPQLDAIATPLENGVAWAAGIYEGEGTVQRHGRKGYVAVRVSQKLPWILEKLRAYFGGSVREYNQTSYNKKYGTNHKMFVWTATGERATAFLSLIKPYLSPRRVAQMEAAYQ